MCAWRASPPAAQGPGTRVCDGILDAVGGTPLVRLRGYLPRAHFQLFGKVDT